MKVLCDVLHALEQRRQGLQICRATGFRESVDSQHRPRRVSPERADSAGFLHSIAPTLEDVILPLREEVEQRSFPTVVRRLQPVRVRGVRLIDESAEWVGGLWPALEQVVFVYQNLHDRLGRAAQAV